MFLKVSLFVFEALCSQGGVSNKKRLSYNKTLASGQINEHSAGEFLSGSFKLLRDSDTIACIRYLFIENCNHDLMANIKREVKNQM